MLLDAEAVGLACLTILLAGPVPGALANAQWTARSPRAALFLWQAVGLGGGLGILTAGLTLAAASSGHHWLPGLLAVPSHWSHLGAYGWFGAALTGCVGAWLAGAAATSTSRVLHARHAHRRRLDLIAAAQLLDVPTTGRGGMHVQVVDHPWAIAYCLPGLRPRVVLSRGALSTLDAKQLTAVLAHERAHARGHHDLVAQPFIAWAHTFPFLSPTHRAVAAVDLLIEMLADDSALHHCRPADLRNALQRLADEQSAVTGAADIDLHQQLAARAERLGPTAHTLPQPITALIYASAAALVVAPPIVLLCS